MTNHTTRVGLAIFHPTPYLTLLLFIAAFVLSGCGGVSKQTGFNAVQGQVDKRIGYRVHWNADTAVDEEVTQAVQDLLGEPLTADAAVQIALLNNRRLQATYEELGIAQAAVVDAGLLSNPVFHGVVTFGLSDEAAAAESTDDSKYTFEVEMDFLSVLYAPMRKSVAKAEFEAAKLRVMAAVMDLAGQTRTAFYRVQADEQMLEMFQQIVLATQAGYEFAQRLVEAGNIPELDLLLQQGLYERSKLDLASAEVTVAESREQLNTLMGLWGENTAWRVASPLPEVPAESMEFENLEKIAIEKSIDLALARQNIVSIGKQLGIAKATRLVPVLDLGAEVEREKGEWAAGPALGFEIPLFDRNQGRVAAAKSELRRRQQEFRALGVEIRAAVRTARRRLLTARQTALFYRNEMLPLQEKIIGQLQLQYNAMQVGVFRLLQAKQQEIDTGRDYIQALLNYHIARAALEHILNGRLMTGRSSTRSMANVISATGMADAQGGH